jgi:hypothetical protein
MAGGNHPLEQTWQIYLHYPYTPYLSQGKSYSTEAYQSLCEFATVEDFWR